MDEQTLQILKKYNYTPRTSTYGGSSPTQTNIENRLAELDNLTKTNIANTEKKQQPTFEKVTNTVAGLTGGKKIGQGIGQALTQNETQAKLQENQDVGTEITVSLIKRIREKKANGEDTTRLENALKELGGTLQEEGANREKALNPNEITNKQVLGDALQLATTVVGAGTLPGASKAVTSANTVGQGIVQGAKTGAVTGAGFGGATGISQGLQKDESTQEILKKGALGALGGGVAGGVLGAVTGGISGGIKAKKLNKENKSFIDELITPPVETGKTGINALKTGKVEEGKGVFGKRDYTQAIQNFDKVKESVARVPGISAKNTNLQNLNAIHDEIGTTANSLNEQIKGKGFFSPKEFNSYMGGIKKELKENPTIVGDAEKTADKILTKFNSLIKKNGYTPEGLLTSRKQLDSWMSSQKGNVFSPNSENAVSIALRAIRQGGNDFLASRVKDVAVKDMLTYQARLYNAIDIIAPKAQKEGASFASRLVGKIRKHPIGAMATGLGAGAVINQVIGE